MRALHIAAGKVELREDLERPARSSRGPRAGETRVRVSCAGVCATDLALARGYMDFEGVPGHEFVGVALDGPLAGRRVVGEINAGCGGCPTCAAGLARHCPERTVLGILGRPGAFAEELSLPHANLHALPEELSDERAVFVEPLAAAFEIAEQVELRRGTRALLIGDGRLGILCAHVLARHGVEPVIAGRHPERRELLPPAASSLDEPLETRAGSERFELVVEASGDPDVLPLALARTRPRGTLVLKTTSERPARFDLAPLVVDEIRLVGSRCGPFEPALRALVEGTLPVEAMIAARFPLERGARALARAGEPGVLKVLIEMQR